jgi:glucose-1-phosphatase
MIKAITFDLDGVYFINGKSNFIFSLIKLGVTEEEVKRVFLESDQMNKYYKTGKMSDNEFWRWAASEWNLEKTPKELIELLISGYEVDKDVVETVKRVRKSGFKTLICTNNFPARINGLQGKFNFLDNFDEKVFSYNIGYLKPDVKIFEELVKVSGVKANEIVYADDNEDKLTGAKQIGMNAFVYEGFDKFKKKLKDLGVNF